MENNGQVPIIAERDRYRKQLTFDIDTKTLEIYYPKANWRHGYDDIRGFLKREGFEWCEGTVYVSKKPLESYEVTKNASKDPHSAKKRSTGLKKKTPDQMKLHNFFEMNVMER